MTTAWTAIAEAPEVRRPDGRLNDRAWAEARIAERLSALRGRAWKPVVGHLRATAAESVASAALCVPAGAAPPHRVHSLTYGRHHVMMIK